MPSRVADAYEVGRDFHILHEPQRIRALAPVYPIGGFDYGQYGFRRGSRPLNTEYCREDFCRKKPYCGTFNVVVMPAEETVANGSLP